MRCLANQWRFIISQVTNAVMDEVKVWQHRPLTKLYPVVYLYCLVVRSRDSGVVQNKSVYLALGINTDGEKGSSACGWHNLKALSSGYP